MASAESLFLETISFDSQERNLIRRRLVLGEQILCWIKRGDKKAPFEIHDISLGGIGGVVRTRWKGLGTLEAGDQIKLIFVKANTFRFEMDASIIHYKLEISTQFNGAKIGLKLSRKFCRSSSEFANELGEKLKFCKTYIRPQISSEDPYFFLEHLYFQVNAFSPNGVVLVSSLRNNTLLPGQSLDVDLFIPGRGNFKAVLEVGKAIYRYKKDRFLFYARYKKAPQPMLEAISEYLVMFSKVDSLSELRNEGFQIGAMDRAFSISNDKMPSTFVLDSEGMGPGAFGLAEDFSRNPDDPDAEDCTRCVLGKFGPHKLFRAEVIIVDKKLERSIFVRSGYEVPDRIFRGGHIELVRFYGSNVAKLGDFLLYFIKHLVRIASQFTMQYIVVEALDDLGAILTKLGFKRGDKLTASEPNTEGQQRYSLFYLKVDRALRNIEHGIAPAIWDRLYKDVSEYLNKPQPEHRKNLYTRYDSNAKKIR